MPDVLEEQLAVVVAHLGGVDARRRRAGRASRRTARRAGRRSSGRSLRRSPTSASVHALDLERPAHGGQRAPEAPEQVVVAAAAAERHAERPASDLEDRARVVAEVARSRPRSKITRRAHVLGQQRRSSVAQTVGRGSPAGRRGPQRRRAAAGRASSRASVARPRRDLALQPDEVARDELVQELRRAASPATPQPRPAAPGTGRRSPSADPVARQARRRPARGTARSSASAVPSAPGAPTSSTPACSCSRASPRCGRTRR